MTGSKPEYMELLRGGFPLDDNRTIKSYGVQSHEVWQIVDNDNHSLAKNGGLDNVKLVKKFELTDEEYDKRPGTYRAWKREQLAKDPNWKPKKLVDGKTVGGKKFGLEGASEKKDGQEAEETNDPDEILESVDEVKQKFKEGDRCEVYPGDRRGEVMFVGLIPQITNHSVNQVWIGIKYDEPVGKNDGSVKGKKYFACEKKYGAFVKPQNLKVGDFPVRDDFDFSDDEEEEKNESNCCDDKKSSTPSRTPEKPKEDIMEEL